MILNIKARILRTVNSHKRFFWNMFWQYLLQIAKYLLPFISFPYLTRVLTPEYYAIYAYVMALTSFIQVIIDFGFGLSGVKTISEIKNDKTKVAEVICNITCARLVVCLIVACFMVFLSNSIKILADNQLFVYLSFLAIVFNSLLPDFIFQSYERMKSLTTRYIATKSLSVCAILLFINGPENLLEIAIINLVCAALGYFWTLMVIRTKFEILVNWKIEIKKVFAQLKLSALYCFSNVSSALFTGFSTFIIGIIFDDKTTLAYWSLSVTAIGAVQSFYGPITGSLYPHVVNTKNLSFAYKLALISLPFILIGTSLFVICADLIVQILGGEKYSGASIVLIWLSPILPISFYNMLIGWPILGAVGQVRSLTLTTVISGLLNVFLMSSLVYADTHSLAEVCAIRIFVDALMLLLRAIALRFYIRNNN